MRQQSKPYWTSKRASLGEDFLRRNLDERVQSSDGGLKGIPKRDGLIRVILDGALAGKPQYLSLALTLIEEDANHALEEDLRGPEDLTEELWATFGYPPEAERLEHLARRDRENAADDKASKKAQKAAAKVRPERVPPRTFYEILRVELNRIVEGPDGKRMSRRDHVYHSIYDLCLKGNDQALRMGMALLRRDAKNIELS